MNHRRGDLSIDIAPEINDIVCSRSCSAAHSMQEVGNSRLRTRPDWASCLHILDVQRSHLPRGTGVVNKACRPRPRQRGRAEQGRAVAARHCLLGYPRDPQMDSYQPQQCGHQRGKWSPDLSLGSFCAPWSVHCSRRFGRQHDVRSYCVKDTNLDCLPLQVDRSLDTLKAAGVVCQSFCIPCCSAAVSWGPCESKVGWVHGSIHDKAQGAGCRDSSEGTNNSAHPRAGRLPPLAAARMAAGRRCTTAAMHSPLPETLRPKRLLLM